MTEPKTVQVCRKVVAELQCTKYKGVLVDLTTAGCVLAVWGALSPENQKKFGALSLPQMAKLAFHLVK